MSPDNPNYYNRVNHLMFQGLDLCPPSGNGVHRWLYISALKPAKQHYSAQETERILKILSRGCGRDVPGSEIKDTVHNSRCWLEGNPKRRQSSRGSSYRTPSKVETSNSGTDAKERNIPTILRMAEELGRRGVGGWPPPDPKFYEDETELISTEKVVQSLFPSNALICTGTSFDNGERRVIPCRTLTLTEWERQPTGQRLCDCEFIVPSPMAARWGLTKAGKRSPRTLKNVGPRRHLVTESDIQELDLNAQASLIGGLSVIARVSFGISLASVVWSGGKSLHAWWRVAGIPEARMPGGRRRTGSRRLQEVRYLNPKFLASCTH